MGNAISRRHHGRIGSAGYLSLALVWCAVALWLGGCQSKPVDQTTQNINTFTHAQQQVTDAKAQVGNTLTSLDKFTQKPGLDTYSDFVHQIDETQRQADGIRTTAMAMRDQGDAYFATWDAELATMTNVDLRNQSAEQRAAAQQAYHDIAAKAPEVRVAYDKFMNDLTNLRMYFDRDKTASGVAAASSVIAQTNADGAELQRQLDQESANLARVQSMFTTMKHG
ncbi:MAG TPA: DUF2959 family protein [Tepidisphaeraceae bacterium]|jgi:hypothetical protein